MQSEDSEEDDFGKPVMIDGLMIDDYVPSKSIEQCVSILVANAKAPGK